MKRKGMFLSTLLTLALSLSVCANAADYSFDGIASAEYYPATSYESVYGSRYNYGGANVIDYQYPELPFGVASTTSAGVMEKVRLPGQIVSSGIINVDVSGGGSVYAVPGTYSGSTVTPTPTIYQPTAFTSVDDMKRSDGSIGTVKIPSLDISMKVWEGETDASMAKGMGHYSSTSGWNGNVAVCGHNRGAKYVIGSIKDLKIGDTIKYTTVYGTRTYAVSFVGKISNTDWSYLQATADNRITLTTCLADQPAYRICVQAIEVK